FASLLFATRQHDLALEWRDLPIFLALNSAPVIRPVHFPLEGIGHRSVGEYHRLRTTGVVALHLHETLVELQVIVIQIRRHIVGLITRGIELTPSLLSTLRLKLEIL